MSDKIINENTVKRKLVKCLFAYALNFLVATLCAISFVIWLLCNGGIDNGFSSLPSFSMGWAFLFSFIIPFYIASIILFIKSCYDVLARIIGK